MRAIATKYPDIITLEDGARSRNSEPLFLLRLTDSKVAQAKVSILITFGEHAREFLPVESFFK